MTGQLYQQDTVWYFDIAHDDMVSTYGPFSTKEIAEQELLKHNQATAQKDKAL